MVEQWGQIRERSRLRFAWRSPLTGYRGKSNHWARELSVLPFALFGGQVTAARSLIWTLWTHAFVHEDGRIGIRPIGTQWCKNNTRVTRIGEDGTDAADSYCVVTA